MLTDYGGNNYGNAMNTGNIQLLMSILLMLNLKIACFFGNFLVMAKEHNFKNHTQKKILFQLSPHDGI